MIDREPTDDCIVWPYARGGGGYGYVWMDGSVMRAHRIACERAHGPPPDGRPNALHSCHNPPCVNPRHLRWGNQSDNARDDATIGNVRVGVRNPSSTLTEDDVRAIRAASGTVTQVVLAERYGVAQCTISDVVRRVTWSHVE